MALSWEGLIAAVAFLVAVPILVWQLNKWRKGAGWWLLAAILTALVYMNL